MNQIIRWGVALGSALVLSSPASAAYSSFFGQITNPNLDIPSQTALDGSDANFPILGGTAPNTARDSFVSSFSMGAQDFENVVGGPTTSFSLGSINATLTTAFNVIENNTGLPTGAGLFSVNADSPSTKRLIQASVQSGSAATTFELNFDQSIMAFGFYAVDMGDQGATLNVELFNGTTSVLSTAVPNPTTQGGGDLDGNVLFFGLRAGANTDGAFNRVRLTITGSVDADVIGLDNLYAATRSDLRIDNPPPPGVPEPGSIALAGLALAALGARARRRR